MNYPESKRQKALNLSIGSAPFTSKLVCVKCIQAAKAVGLEFAGVDLIREKMGQTYVTEVNGNPGTGIIEITGKNHFADLVKFIETKSKKNEAVPAPVPLPDEDKKEKQQEESEEEASLRQYKELLSRESKGSLNYNEAGLLAYFKKKFGWLSRSEMH